MAGPSCNHTSLYVANCTCTEVTNPHCDIRCNGCAAIWRHFFDILDVPGRISVDAPSPKYTPEHLTRDDQLRMYALTQAVSNRPIGGTAMNYTVRANLHELVTAAEAFYTFLTGSA